MGTLKQVMKMAPDGQAVWYYMIKVLTQMVSPCLVRP